MKNIEQILTGMPQEGIERINTSKRGGFFDLPTIKKCKDPSHDPPSHICIPQGKGYRHVCPSCGKETVIIPPQISL